MTAPFILSCLVALASPPVAGVALAPHYEGTRTRDQMFDMVDEVRALGANHLVLVVQWGQQDVSDVSIQPYQWGTDDAEIRALADHARAVGLGVVVFPILRLAEVAPGRWRGKLAPVDRARWWRSYRRFILHYARLADDCGAAILSVGSELGSMEDDVAQWKALIAEVRAVFPGRLTYSANWDRFLWVPFWRELDLLGISAYQPLADDLDAGADALNARWRRYRDRLALWQMLQAKPLILTEVGYPSVDGGAVRPYDYERDGPVDLEEQRRAYAAFIDAWRGRRELTGVFFWLWTGRGGAADAGYMPRNKPAGELMRGWFGGHPWVRAP